MHDRSKIKMTINRIQRMETIFDIVQNALNCDSNFCQKDDFVKEMLQILIDYFESGQWLKDYECDEKGELPPDLKRGVLSQDGLCNLISEIDLRGGIRNGK